MLLMLENHWYMYNNIALIMFVLYWSKPIYIDYSRAVKHMLYIQIAGLQMSYLQLIRILIYHSMPYWPNDSPLSPNWW